MKAAVQDAATIRALKPLEIAAYLRAKGWHQEADLDDKASLWLWRNEAGEEIDATLPLKRDLGDFVLRMAELLDTVANVEKRSQLDLVRDFLTTTSDLIRVRSPNRDADSGTLLLEQAVTFVERSRDMMLAAACAALDKRAYYAKRKAQQAMDYLGKIRMGQTERGSYVLTILSPVPPELRPAQEELLPSEPTAPYERQVTQTLIEALTALASAARNAAVHGDMTPFQRAVSRGVSANLCDAVVGLSQVSPDEGLDIRVSWSHGRPVDPSVPIQVGFGSDSIPIIQEAGRLFRERAPVEDVEAEGIVTRLARGPSAKEGDVTIMGSVEGQARNIVVKLGIEDYSKAAQAHDERLTVKCAGDLVKEGRGFRLENARHFEILATDDTE